MKILKKFMMIILIITALILCVSTRANAAELSTQEPIKVADMSNIINAGNEFIRKGEEANNGNTSVEHFATELAPIGSILAAVGLLIFLAVLAIMGIKWVIAKPDQKAKLQQQLIGFVVAAVVFFGAVGIWNLVRGIMGDVQDTVNRTTPSQSVISKRS